MLSLKFYQSWTINLVTNDITNNRKVLQKLNQPLEKHYFSDSIKILSLTYVSGFCFEMT